MIALGFSKDTRISILLHSVSVDRTRNFYAVRGASIYALNMLSKDNNASSTKSDNNQQRVGGESLIIKAGSPPTTGEQAPTTDPNPGADNNSETEEDGDKETVKWVPKKGPYLIKIGKTDCNVYLYDEGGKINLNGVNNKSRDLFVSFLTKKGVDFLDGDIIVDSILDWLDSDDLTHLNGAEDGHYGSLQEPYKSKDDTFDSIEELMLVRGITPEIFERIRNDITVYGDKEIKININFASREVLGSLPGLSDDVIDELVLFLEENGEFSDFDKLREFFWSLGIVGTEFENIRPYITINQSDYVTIRAVSAFSEIEIVQPAKEIGPSNNNNTNGPVQKEEEQKGPGGYEYRLIAGKTNIGYKILAVYPE